MATESKAKVATLAETFIYADSYDYFLMFCGTLGGLITGASIPIFNVLFGQILDKLNTNPGSFSGGINFLCIEFCIVAGANLFTGFAQVYCWSSTGERQTQKFRERYVNSVLSQEIGWFDNCGASELSTKLVEMIGKVQDGMGRKIGDLIQYCMQFVAAMGVAFYLNWKLSLVLLSAIPLIGAAGAFMITAVSSSQQQALEQYAGAGGLASQTLNAIRTVNALNIQPGIVSQYRKFLYDAMVVGVKKGFNVGLGNGMVFGACFLTYALGFWYGGNLVANDLNNCTHNCLTGGQVLAVFFSTIMGSIALGQLAPPLTSFSSARTAIANLLETINRKPEIDGLSEEGLKPDIKVRGQIDLHDLEFAYPSRPGIMVCKNYSLHIEPGQTVALVGQSGCGKSTLINLLLRFYDPIAGKICIDGLDIKTLNIKWLRSQLGYIGQEAVLFAGTIGDNIAYGLDPDVVKKPLTSGKHESSKDANSSRKLSDNPELMEQVVAAARLANAHDFISEFPQGYETDVGSNGVAMSGGQKQRIAIARALIKKPAVLLLDEATSALDANSERIVQQSIDKLAQSKAQTTIIIAHRLSTIRNADKICLIADGKIAEMGTHDELLKLNGKYADLVKIQISGHDDDVASPSRGESKNSDEEEIVEKEVALEAVVAAENGQLISKKSDAGDKKDEISKERKSEVTKRVWALIMRYPGWFVMGTCGAVVFGAVFPCWGYLLARTQNMFYLTTAHEIRQKASLYACYYILISGCSFFSSIAQFFGIVGMGENISMLLRSEMFEALLRRNIGFYDYEENGVGTLTTTLADDSRMVNKAFSESLAKQLQAVFTLTIALALGFSASWKIALVVLACFPVSIAASAVQMQAIAGQQYDDSQGVDEAATRKDVKTAAGDKKDSKVVPKPAAPKGGNSTMAGGHSAVISTAFIQMRTVSAFSMHHKVADYYSSLTREIMEARVKRAVIAGLGFGGAQTSMFLTYALLFWYGSRLIETDHLPFVDLMTAILTLMLGALGLGQALSDLGDQGTALSAASRIFDAIDAGKQSPIDGLSTNGITPNCRVKGRIELKNVTFRYPTRPHAEVCKGYNLTIEEGEIVAFVGASGSGKSTIMSLLLRFYDPLEGQILLDGIDIKSYNLRYLRSQLGFVGQEPTLFAGSVAENVARGRSANIDQPLLTLEEAVVLSEQERRAQGGSAYYYLPCFTMGGRTSGAALTGHDATQVIKDGPVATNDLDIELGNKVKGKNGGGPVDEDIIEACRAANAHGFISEFTHGYDTDIGEGSIMLSGGQKQRIAIARALIKKPAVLLLDEATSALDANSEHIVQQSIDALAQSKSQTTIIIAHRLSTIRNADKICVIDKGQIVEIGTHDELLTCADGLYKQLWEKQSGVSPSPSKSDMQRSASKGMVATTP